MRDEGWVSTEGRPMFWQVLGPQDVHGMDYIRETGQAWVRAGGETFLMQTSFAGWGLSVLPLPLIPEAWKIPQRFRLSSKGNILKIPHSFQ